MEAPPEEELLGGGLGQPDALEWEVPLDDISNVTAFALDEHQRAPDDSMPNSVTANFADLSVASELLAQPQSQVFASSESMNRPCLVSDHASPFAQAYKRVHYLPSICAWHRLKLLSSFYHSTNILPVVHLYCNIYCNNGSNKLLTHVCVHLPSAWGYCRPFQLRDC